jgi:hypothetical protein
MPRRLIDCARSVFSQYGEDGIIGRIFEVVGEGGRFCCEFGAWDGVYLSNTRALIERGWSALLIEGDRVRYSDLRSRNANLDRIVCVHAFVDAGANSLPLILRRHGLAERQLDLLSIDIDGLDYEIFGTLADMPARPRVVVVEVQPEHGWQRTELVPHSVARHGIGQPLGAFVLRGQTLGYRLVCYIGPNAIFLSSDAGGVDALPTLCTEEAWEHSIQVFRQSQKHAEYLYLRNLGLEAHPYYRFQNDRLSQDYLGIAPERAAMLRRKANWRKLRRQTKRLVRHIIPPTRSRADV